MYLLELMVLRKYENICDKLEASSGALSHFNPFRKCVKGLTKVE